MTTSPKHEQWQEWLEEFQKETDRACAVLGAAFVEEHLAELLRSFFVNDKGKIDSLFEGGNAPLGTLSAKIQVAYALGYISPIELHDLNLIRKIRNDFAHHLHGLSFSEQKIASRCIELSTPDRMFDSSSSSPRNRFILTVVIISQLIASRRMMENEKRTIQKEPDIIKSVTEGGFHKT